MRRFTAHSGGIVMAGGHIRVPMADAWVAPRPSHPETCPNCGKLTWRWKYLQSRQWFECEHCGFSGKASSTPGFKRA